MGAEYYDNQMAQLRGKIGQCESQIKVLKEQIEDLEGLWEALGQHIENLGAIPDTITCGFNQPGGGVLGRLARIGLSFFQPLEDAATGEEFQTAVRHAESSQLAAENKKTELEQKIEQLRGQINSYSGQISQLSQQKSAYLEEEAKKAAEKSAAANAQ